MRERERQSESERETHREKKTETPSERENTHTRTHKHTGLVKQSHPVPLSRSQVVASISCAFHHGYAQKHLDKAMRDAEVLGAGSLVVENEGEASYYVSIQGEAG